MKQVFWFLFCLVRFGSVCCDAPHCGHVCYIVQLSTSLRVCMSVCVCVLCLYLVWA